jgi:predicted transposase YbfD/YdcC
VDAEPFPEVMEMEGLKERLSIVPDYRHPSYVEHKLCDILIIVMVAVLCGLDQLNDLVVFAHERKEFFAKHFEITAIPSKPTFSRVLNMIKADALVQVIVEIMKERIGEVGRIIAFDGKAIRSTGEKGKPTSALQILSAYLVEGGIVLGQESIHEKTNEIPVLRDMLEYIDVRGKIVTADAMHCQRETCAKIVDESHGGDYVIGLKENQGTLYNDVALFFNDKINNDSIEAHTTLEMNGGRIERRICRQTNRLNWLAYHKWPGLRSVFSVRRIVTTGDKVSDETSYYIASVETSSSELLEISRAHWMIESLHWMLDEDFSEDTCRLLSDNGQQVLNVFRKMALSIHRNYMKKQLTKRSVKSNLLRCLISDRALLDLLHSL